MYHQDQVKLLENSIENLANILNFIEYINYSDLKIKLTEIFNDIVFLHPAQCVNLSIVIHRLSKTIDILAEIDSQLSLYKDLGNLFREITALNLNSLENMKQLKDSLIGIK